MSQSPNTFIVGAAKTGTTSLFEYLVQHPDVSLPEIKESHYFSLGLIGRDFGGPGDRESVSHVPQSLAEYEALFDGCDNPIRIDGSTSYFPCEKSAAAIKEYCPDGKILIGLRNPARRSFSAYSHLRRAQRETELDFRDGLELEAERTAENFIYMWRYRAVSRYYEHVKRFYDTFDRDQIYLFIFERFIKDPKTELANVCSFLGIDDQFAFDTDQKHNQSAVMDDGAFSKAVYSGNPVVKVLKKLIPSGIKQKLVKSRTYKLELDQEIYESLNQEFASEIDQVEALVGQDMSLLRG